MRSKLIKAAEWVNVAHERHLDQITDANTLFLLSADATPDDVRQWAWSVALLVIHQAGRMFNSGSGRHLAHGNQDQWRR
jgi:hypothetical protein